MVKKCPVSTLRAYFPILLGLDLIQHHIVNHNNFSCQIMSSRNIHYTIEILSRLLNIRAYNFNRVRICKGYFSWDSFFFLSRMNQSLTQNWHRLVYKSKAASWIHNGWEQKLLIDMKIALKYALKMDHKDWPAKKVTIYFPIFYLVKSSENTLFFYLHFTWLCGSWNHQRVLKK